MMSTVYTGGTFDLFHIGHINLLKVCKKIARTGRVVVALNTDEFVETYKGTPPVMDYANREAVLLNSIYVDEVIKNEGNQDSKPAILKVNPEFIVIGSDWATKDYYSQMAFTQEWLDEKNITLLYVPYTKNISSTMIKERLNHG